MSSRQQRRKRPRKSKRPKKPKKPKRKKPKKLKRPAMKTRRILHFVDCAVDDCCAETLEEARKREEEARAAHSVISESM